MTFNRDYDNRFDYTSDSSRDQAPDGPMQSEPIQPETMFDDGWWRYVIALLLMVVGSAALFINFGLLRFFDFQPNLPAFEFSLDRFNMWALWLLVPIFFSLTRLLPAVLRDGDTSAEVGRQVSGILFLGLLFTIFFFGLSWWKLWPLFFIFGGFKHMFWGGHRRRRHWGWW